MNKNYDKEEDLRINILLPGYKKRFDALVTKIEQEIKTGSLKLAPTIRFLINEAIIKSKKI